MVKVILLKLERATQQRRSRRVRRCSSRKPDGHQVWVFVQMEGGFSTCLGSLEPWPRNIFFTSVGQLQVSASDSSQQGVLEALQSLCVKLKLLREVSAKTSCQLALMYISLGSPAHFSVKLNCNRFHKKMILNALR